MRVCVYKIKYTQQSNLIFLNNLAPKIRSKDQKYHNVTDWYEHQVFSSLAFHLLLTPKACIYASRKSTAYSVNWWELLAPNRDICVLEGQLLTTTQHHTCLFLYRRQVVQFSSPIKLCLLPVLVLLLDPKESLSCS